MKRALGMCALQKVRGYETQCDIKDLEVFPDILLGWRKPEQEV